ncbi:MAG: hypothetical protein FJ295_07095 [Planctomycetes bacterium]|nr:hypothetical protein [Planctomycetota bacterium]
MIASTVALAVVLPAITAFLAGAATYRLPMARPSCGAIALAAAMLASTYAHPPWDARRDRTRRHWHWFAELALTAAIVSPLLDGLRDRGSTAVVKVRSPRLRWAKVLASAVAVVVVAVLAAWFVVPSYSSLVPRPPVWRFVLAAEIILLTLSTRFLIRHSTLRATAIACLLGSVLVIAGIAFGSSLTFAQAALPALSATAGLALLAAFVGDKLVLYSAGCGSAVLHAGWSLVATVEPVRPQTWLLACPWATVLALAIAAAVRGVRHRKQLP